MENKKADKLASELLKTIRLQRQAFIYDANGKKIITNYLLFNQLEEESLRIQEKMGRENEREMMKNPEYIAYRKKHKSHGEGQPHTKLCFL